MESARKYGFITYAYGGIAMLMTHRNQLEQGGSESYVTMRKAELTDYSKVFSNTGDLFGMDHFGDSDFSPLEWGKK